MRKPQIKLEYHKDFQKAYKKLIKSNPRLKDKIISRLHLFLDNPKNFLLKDHALVGEMEELRSFSITSDIRIIYVRYNDLIVFLDIGTHNQVY